MINLVGSPVTPLIWQPPASEFISLYVMCVLIVGISTALSTFFGIGDTGDKILSLAFEKALFESRVVFATLLIANGDPDGDFVAPFTKNDYPQIMR
jgi:hypothetical protein